MDRLQQEGVPSGVVQRSSDLMQDPQLKHRKFFRDLDLRFAAPALGQHNEHVLKELLGMSEDEITEAIIAEALE